MHRHIDRAFEDWCLPGASANARGRTAAWPPTNVFETKEAFLVKAEVPGAAR